MERLIILCPKRIIDNDKEYDIIINYDDNTNQWVGIICNENDKKLTFMDTYFLNLCELINEYLCQNQIPFQYEYKVFFVEDYKDLYI